MCTKSWSVLIEVVKLLLSHFIKYSFLIISNSAVLDCSRYIFLVINTLFYATLPGTCWEAPHILKLLTYDAECCSAWVAMVGKPMMYSSISALAVKSQDPYTKIMSTYPSPVNFIVIINKTKA